MLAGVGTNEERAPLIASDTSNYDTLRLTQPQDVANSRPVPLPTSSSNTYATKARTPPSATPSSSSSSIQKLKSWIGVTGISLDYSYSLPGRTSSRKQDGASRAERAAGDGDADGDLAGTVKWRQTDTRQDKGNGWWNERLGQEALIVPLLVITFSCALADAGTLIQYSTFATSMTGNTVLVAVALMKATDKSPLYAAVSLAGFIGTGLVTGQLGAAYGNRSRSWLMSSMIFQIFFLIAALVVVSPKGPLENGYELDWVYVLFIGIQGGAQVTMAANSGARELPTAMMTTPYAAFVSDPTLFRSGAHHDVRARNRRFIYILVFWGGSSLGAAIAKYSTLWVMTVIVLICKVLVAGMIVISRGEKGGEKGRGRAGEEVQERERDGTGQEPREGDGARGEDSFPGAIGQETVGDGISTPALVSTRLGGIQDIEQRDSRGKRRSSSVFDRLADQEPRDERNVAF